MSMQHPVIIMGGGQMGGALARFWSEHGVAGVHAVERDPSRRASLSGSGIRAYASLAEAPIKKGILILAIKPQQFAGLDNESRTQIGHAALVISIMAGTPLSALLAIHPHCARVMPNLPTAIGQGMSVGHAPALEAARKRAVTELFSAAGKFLWLDDEAMMHAATAISGSGPAYVYAFLEAFIQAGEARGFSANDARELATQTLFGAALQASQSRTDAAALRQQVASPGGTTEAALKPLLAALPGLLDEATSAAENRSRELAAAPPPSVF